MDSSEALLGLSSGSRPALLRLSSGSSRALLSCFGSCDRLKAVETIKDDMGYHTVHRSYIRVMTCMLSYTYED